VWIADKSLRFRSLQGNFIFQTKTPVQFYGGEVWQSVIVHLHCNDVAEATSYSVKLIPVVLNEVGETEETHLQTRGLPRLASRVDGQQILQKLQQLSAPFGTTITIESAAEDADSPVIGWVLGAQVPKGTPIDDGILAKAIFSLDVAAPAPKLPLSAAAKTAPDTSSLQLQVPEIPFASRELSPQAATFSHDETMTPF
jgi:hypothetical protein